MQNLYIVTPLRDEASNIPALFQAISDSTRKIHGWIIIENNSTDGSKEILKKIKKPDSVDNLTILTADNISSEYALGRKYSGIVNEGFKYILDSYPLDDDDMIGIVDADSFPEADYFRKLERQFDSDDSLGITSGHSIEINSKKRSIHSKSWVMGSCRLWRHKCFKECGYLIAPSADTISLALAVTKNWSAYPTEMAEFYSREVGKRVNYSYYGKSAYYRGNTPTYAIARCLKFVLKLQINNAKSFGKGYFSSLIQKEEKIDNETVLTYFKETIPRKIKTKLCKSK